MNHLKGSTSPYLLQHAENPVDWYPWGDEALQKAQAENKPILLSVGYSACHWCHVMAHESFEDPDTAAIMNRDFVSIKVDREERPDIDEIYMQATLMFNQGNGGWPMTVFLTPDGRPFHAGTYYPKEDRYGMPSFQRVMAAVMDAYRHRPTQVEQIASQVTGGLQMGALDSLDDKDGLTPRLLEEAYYSIARNFDSTNGGLTKGRPKFPAPMNLDFVLRMYVRKGGEWKRALEIVTFTLRKMARGGIYDQLGGGFARYSVDERWLVPHFEKMLYDNAQLSRLYLHTWQVTGEDFFKRIAVEIYDYILREMTSPEGGFYSATDADSEGEEGKFFVWTPDEIREALGNGFSPNEIKVILEYWGVTEAGNFEGKNILNVPIDEDVVEHKHGVKLELLRDLIERARDKLFAARTQRVPPGLDDKILTAWNGLMLASLAEAARALDREDYKQFAVRNAEFILSSLRRDGRLLRSHKDGKSQYNGYLEDYANLIDGLLELFQTTFETRYFEEATRLAEIVLTHFAVSGGGFFDTSDDHEKLIARPRNVQDNAIPSGNSMMAKNLARLSAYTGDARYEDAARGTLLGVVAAMEKYPTAFGEALSAAELLIGGQREIAIIGDPKTEATQALLKVLMAGYYPDAVLALSPDDVEAEADIAPKLLAGRGLVDGKPAVYICQHFTCQMPITEPDALREALSGKKG